ncbi:alpha/beta hydrolase [Cytophagaceae bacterium ABcell3]|nr:alpha/beta hydrolase [Cytophagaceae bacterium ABcell3]
MAKPTGISSMYIKLENDREFSVGVQNKMAQNLKAEKVKTLKSGHLPILSRPEEVAEILNKFINAL